MTIVRVGNACIAPEVASKLADRLGRRLHLAVAVEAGTFLPDVGFAEGADAPGMAGDREGSDLTDLPRVSSNEIVDALAERFPRDDDGWVLGITAHDLTAPGRSYVFGEAALGGRWAVVSLARLGPADASSPRSQERLFKEAVHELGHLAGLGHCQAGEGCVMEVSITVSAIDARNSEFCAHCGAEFTRKQVEG